MQQIPTLYRDVTDAPWAIQHTHPAPTWRTYLLAHGFRRVGLLTSHESVSADAAPLELDLLPDAAQPDEVIEVLTSPDRHAFATVETVAGEPLLCLRTITEKGVVIETAMRPTRPILEDTRGLALRHRLRQQVTHRAARWPHANRPRAGYHVALIATRDPQELFQQHQQRLGVLRWASYTTIRRHKNLRLYTAILRRAAQISQHDGRIEHRIAHTLASTITLLPLVCLIWMLWISQPAALDQLPDGLLLYGPALALVPTLLLYGLYFLLISWVRGKLLPRWPGPALQPVESLLGEVRL
jgi:hypothetical protein